MCKESMQEEIINNKKKSPASLLFFTEIRTTNIFFYFFFTWSLAFSGRAKFRTFNEIVVINLWMLCVGIPRARGDMKFPFSKQPCIIMFLCLFLRLFCAMRVTGFLRSVYIIYYY